MKEYELISYFVIGKHRGEIMDTSYALAKNWRDAAKKHEYVIKGKTKVAYRDGVKGKCFIHTLPGEHGFSPTNPYSKSKVCVFEMKKGFKIGTKSI